MDAEDSDDTGDPDAVDDTDAADDTGAADDTDAAIDAILGAYALKDEGRTGWQLRGVDAPESVAAHTWGVAYLVLALGDRFREDLPGVDLDRALRLAVVHDVAEAETGDVATRADSTADRVDHASKEATERAAMVDLAGPLPDDVRDAWEAYEARETPEAVLVKECDLLDTCLQAVLYEREDRYDPADGKPEAFAEYDALEEFFATTESRLRTGTGRALFERLRARYRTVRARSATPEGGDSDGAE
ncbi:HD family hydrolase [Halorubrum sp. F4]|uniref:HD domain-containing protein n=1 Tax=Halorubrum sp. F4 TaxID=2989715 RepID=UPI00247FB96C|nr:HD domain-containing protein [Halorubrum sp. F4]